MLNGILGQKSSQIQGFLTNGKRIPLTVVHTLGNTISQVKTSEKEGYNAVQIGLGNKKKANKAEEGLSKKAGIKQTPRFFKELRLEDVSEFKPGMEIVASEIFQPGDLVDVVGVSKGKGFAGGVKKHHFKGGPRTHGQSDRERAPGSIGQTTTPGRVYKGKRMAGRMGHETVTKKNLEVIEVKEDGVILLKGLVPGPLKSLIIIKKVGENKKFIPLYKEETEASKETEAEDAQTEEIIEEVKEETEVVVEAVDTQEKNGDIGSLPVSDDVQKTQKDTSSSEPSSLNGSQLPESEEETKSKEELTSNSSENGQTTVVPEKDTQIEENQPEAQEIEKEEDK